MCSLWLVSFSMASTISGMCLVAGVTMFRLFQAQSGGVFEERLRVNVRIVLNAIYVLSPRSG